MLSSAAAALTEGALERSHFLVNGRFWQFCCRDIYTIQSRISAMKWSQGQTAICSDNTVAL